MGMKEGAMSTALLPQETWGRKVARSALRGAWDAPATDPSRTKAQGTGHPPSSVAWGPRDCEPQGEVWTQHGP